MTNHERARRYLQASMSAGYADQKPEAVQAAHDLMNAHERAYPDVRRHALSGENRDFDEALQPGEREHQQHLRRQDNMSHQDILDTRKEIRGSGAPARRAPSRAQRRSSSPARTAAGAATGAIGTGFDVATGKAGGSIIVQLIGLLLFLSLVYLLVAGKGTKALSGIATAIEGGIKAFISPEDPILKLETALGASPVAAGSAGGEASGTGASGTTTPTQSAGAAGGADASSPAPAA
jgi:hypothetical protein